MTVSEWFYIAVFSGVAGGVASFMSIAYDRFEKIPTIKEVEEKVKGQKRYMFLIIRIYFSVLTALIFALWFFDDAVTGSISQSKFAFYLCILSASTTVLLDVSNGFKKVIHKWLQ